MANQLNKRGADGWRYPLTSVTLDNRVHPSAVRPGFLTALAGIDGRVQGGLRPYPGFKTVRRLGVSLDNAAGAPLISSYNIDALLDLFSVTLHAGSSDVLGGFVARITDAGTSRVVFEWFSEDSTWRAVELEVDDATGSPPIDVTVGQMDVAFIGRLLYVFRKGRPPILVYFKRADANSPWLPVIVTDTGPGVRPPAPTVALAASDGGQKPPGVKLEPGDYSFAYQLRDTVTGRLSAVSDVATISQSDFPLDANGVPQPQFVSFTLGMVSGPPFFDSGSVLKWDQLRAYRTVRTEFAGAAINSAILQLDRVLPISPGGGGIFLDGVSTWYYELPDLALRYQDVYQDKAEFDPQMPAAGAAAFHSGILFTSSNRSSTSAGFSGIGEIRWSSTVELAPELFPPDNTFPTVSTADEPIRFIEVSDVLYAFTPSRAYVTTRLGPFPSRPQRIHEGYGLTHARAAVGVSNSVFLLTPLGFATMDSSANLSALTVFDNKVFGSWASSLGSVRAAYDAPTSCVYFVNTTQKEAACFWLNTRMTSTLEDMGFVAVADGVDPTAASDDRRAFFGNARGVVFTPDATRSRTGPSGDTVYSMFPLNGQVSHATLTAATAGGAKELVFANSLLYSNDLVGSSVYFVSGAEKGNSYGVLTADAVGFFVEQPDGSGLAVGAAAGDQILISPVVVRVKGWPVGDIEDPLNPSPIADQFRARVVNSIGAHFQNVAGLAASTPEVATYTGAVYVGHSPAPALTGSPVARDGLTPIVSITDDPTPFWARMGVSGVRGAILLPEVLALAGDLDFILLGLTVNGRVEAFNAQT